MRKLFLIAALFLTSIQVNARTYIDMGEFKLTAYCPCEECSEGWGVKTYSGKIAEEGRTIAVDRSVIDIGSKVKIGDHIYTAEDIGGGVKGDHIDIFFDSHEEVKAFNDGKGIKYTNVWVVRDNEEEK